MSILRRGRFMARECPCGSGETYEACCGRYIEGGAHAPTAVALMRSRYSAYALKNADYIVATSLKDEKHASIEQAMKESDFYRLEILSHKKGGVLDRKGEVTFKAFYKTFCRTPQGEGVLHERSAFVRKKGRWFYDEENSTIL
jgi:SEC-C motif-containing protein